MTVNKKRCGCWKTVRTGGLKAYNGW